MTPIEKAFVLKTANAARLAGGKAWKAAREAAKPNFYHIYKPLAKAAEAAAIEAYRAAQAAEDAALSLDPEEALENEAVWETHCTAMGAAAYARKAADEAFYGTDPAR